MPSKAPLEKRAHELTVAFPYGHKPFSLETMTLHILWVMEQEKKARMHEYQGIVTFDVTDSERGPVLRFLRDDEIITEIRLSRAGADRLGQALLRRSYEHR